MVQPRWMKENGLGVNSETWSKWKELPQEEKDLWRAKVGGGEPSNTRVWSGSHATIGAKLGSYNAGLRRDLTAWVMHIGHR